MPKRIPSAVGAPVTMLVTIHTAALLLSSTPWTVRRLIWAKKIPAVKIGRRCLVDPLDLQAYIVKLKAAA